MVRFSEPRLIGRIVLSLLLVATGCSSAKNDRATTTSPTPTPAPSLVAGKAVSRLPTPGEPLDPNGFYFGYIRCIDPSPAPSKLQLDVAELLTGEDALSAAVEAEVAVGPEGLSNDFFIRNRSTAVRDVQVAPDVSITLISCNGGCGGIPVSWSDLVGILMEPLPEGGDGFCGSPQSLFWITLKDGRASVIEEQYLP